MRPQLLIPLSVYKQLFSYVRIAEGEITGFFDVDYLGNNCWWMKKVYLIEQEAGEAHVEMDEDAIAKFMDQLMQQDVDQMPRGWWHSHVDMEAFFSPVDEDAIEQLENETFMVHLVVNKNEEFKCVIMLYGGDYTYRIEDVQMVVDYRFRDEDIEDKYIAEVAEKVKEKKHFWDFGKQKEFKFTQSNTPLFLPKDRKEALARIEKFDLIQVYLPSEHIVLWKDKDSGQLWKDIWHVLDDEAKDFVKRIEKASGEKLGKSKAEKELEKKAEGLMEGTFMRCVHCGYSEEFHNSDNCLMPEFQETKLLGGKSANA